MEEGGIERQEVGGDWINHQVCNQKTCTEKAIRGDKMGTLKFVLFVLLRQYVIYSILTSNSDVAEDDLRLLVLLHSPTRLGLKAHATSFILSQEMDSK